MMSSTGAGRYMAFPPSPSAPHSLHISGLRSTASTALAEHDNTFSSFLLVAVPLPILFSLNFLRGIKLLKFQCLMVQLLEAAELNEKIQDVQGNGENSKVEKKKKKVVLGKETDWIFTFIKNRLQSERQNAAENS